MHDNDDLRIMYSIELLLLYVVSMIIIIIVHHCLLRGRVHVAHSTHLATIIHFAYCCYIITKILAQ